MTTLQTDGIQTVKAGHELEVAEHKAGLPVSASGVTWSGF
jgi:hypothetical protein